MLYQNFTQKYALSKTLRFELQPIDVDGNRLENIAPVTNLSQATSNTSITSFYSIFKPCLDDIEKLLFYIKNDTKQLTNSLSVKHRWLKTYTKQNFYENKEQIVKFNNGRKQGNKIKISDTAVLFLAEYFTNWLDSNKELVEALNTARNAPLESQKRREEFAYLLRAINKRSGFEAIYELFNGNIEHSRDDQTIKTIFTRLDECKAKLLALETDYLPSQSLGREIERGSLNYYTVNKTPKDYEDLLEKKNNEMNKKMKDVFSFDSKQLKTLKDSGFTETNLPFNKVKEEMKKYKGAQKSAFYEAVNQGKTLQDIKNSKTILLFDDIALKDFTDFKNTTDNAKRGKHFIHNFKKYKDYCDIYKNIAVKYGKLKAEIKGLQQEKVDAERLKNWVIVLEKGNDKYLCLIPRQADNLAQAKKFIDKLIPTKNGQWLYYQFESLTLPAFHKLCFGKVNNSFAPLIVGELLTKCPQYFNNGKMKREDEFDKSNDTELIQFCQAVLGLSKTQELLAIQKFFEFNALITTTYKNMPDFEQALKETCYYKESKAINKETLHQLMQTYSAKLYKVTSYDLEKTRNNPEYHSQIWWDFWSVDNAKNHHITRLNPEIKIHSVDVLKNEVPDPKRSRKGRQRLLLSTTISLNATAPTLKLSFQSQEEIKASIEKYNNAFTEKMKTSQGGKSQEMYYYGLDRGQQELLTLGIFRFNHNETIAYEDESKKTKYFPKPEFIRIPAYRIKDKKLIAQYTNKTGQEKLIYQSPARFIDNQAVIEEVEVNSCLDLSFAKMIAGKLVVNGDIATYLELKRISALRKIWENAMKGLYKNGTVDFNSQEKYLFLQYKNREKLEEDKLYFFDNQFSNIVPLEKIQKELQNYYDLLRSFNGKETPENQYLFYSIEKVNHLRDAICANAVGVISFLLNQYPGMICFEDLNTDNKNKRVSEFSGNLASRIEIKLLHKLQTLGLAPPTDKQVISLVSQKKITQLGAMLYVETAGTSANCPRCGTHNPDKTTKWKDGSFICNNKAKTFSCGFNSNNNRLGLEPLNNSDKVATYNIAKKGFNKINHSPSV